jgi:uncharacterized protein (TIGR03435 family)
MQSRHEKIQLWRSNPVNDKQWGSRIEKGFPISMSNSLNRRLSVLAATFIALIQPLVLDAQTNPTPNPSSQLTSTETKPLAFDVVSIKLNKSGDHNGSSSIRPNGISMTNMPLATFISMGFFRSQVIGAPEWLHDDRYDFEAKVAESDLAAYHHASPSERNRMLLAAFEDRLKLKEHQETRELPVFSLVLAKNGSKLKENTSVDSEERPSPSQGRYEGGGLFWIPRGSSGENQLIGQGASTARLAMRLSYMAGIDRLVVDKTGLTGKYDFSLEWAFPNATDSSAPSITTAIQEQLGLKLESTKAPVEVLVIDHIERPTEN